MYAEATRAALLEAATKLFAERGFAATSLDDVARAANVTRGAVYHHFTNKLALFTAVFDEQERQIVERAESVMLQGHEDLWEAALAGVDQFLDACLEPVYSAIVWREAIGAMGWNAWMEFAEQHSLGLVERSVEVLAAAGLIDSANRKTTTRLVFHLLGGAGMTLANAENPAELRPVVGATVRRMISSLRATDQS